MDKFNPFTFDGRIGRLQYFGFAVIWGLILFFVSVAIGLGTAPSGEPGAGGTLASLGFLLVYFIATISYGVRRLQDFDKNGWWYLLAFIPGVNLVMALILLLAPGTQGPNSYGTR